MKKWLVLLVLFVSGAMMAMAEDEKKPVSLKPVSRSGETIFYLADRGKLEPLRLILRQTPEALEERDADGWTPLMHAARFGQLETVKFLIRQKANVNARDKHGYTALHQAASYDHLEVIDELLNAGANVNARTEGSVTPRRLAISNGNARAAKALADRGGLQ